MAATPRAVRSSGACAVSGPRRDLGRHLMGVGFLLHIEGLQRTTASRSAFSRATLVVLVPLIELACRKRPALPATFECCWRSSGSRPLRALVERFAHHLGRDALTLGCALVFAAHVSRSGGWREAPRLLDAALATRHHRSPGRSRRTMVEAQHFSGTPRLWLALLYLALFPTLCPVWTPNRRSVGNRPGRAAPARGGRAGEVLRLHHRPARAARTPVWRVARSSIEETGCFAATRRARPRARRKPARSPSVSASPAQVVVRSVRPGAERTVIPTNASSTPKWPATPAACEQASSISARAPPGCP